MFRKTQYTIAAVSSFLVILAISIFAFASEIVASDIYLPLAMQSTIQARSSGQQPNLPPGEYALSFDGVNDIVAIDRPDPALNTLTSYVTYESWIYAKSLRNYERIIDRSDDDSYDRWVFALYSNTGGIAININRQVAHSQQIPLNEWIHVAATYDGTVEKLYVNGELVGTNAYIGEIDVTDAKVSIGNNFENFRQFHGYITDVRIWCVARTQEQINEAMSMTLNGDEEGLLSYWPMNEGSGQTVSDFAGSSTGNLGLNTVTDPNDPMWVAIE